MPNLVIVGDMEVVILTPSFAIKNRGATTPNSSHLTQEAGLWNSPSTSPFIMWP